MSKPVLVTVPFMPPLEEFIPYLLEIWDSKVLSNNGRFHRALELELAACLGVDHISLFANGTLALLTALRALQISGEVITTPYSFVATTHALKWANLEPVFVDIDPKTCSLDATKVEEAITPRTSAIMPVHCYGYPCAVEQLQTIALEHNLKLLYDSAHAFGVKHKGRTLLKHGDYSAISFHATKPFNTFEGGALISSSAELKKKADSLKGFGLSDDGSVSDIGINAKMSEFNAAFGLLQLKHYERTVKQRFRVDRMYRKALGQTRGISLLQPPADTDSNYSYFPIFVDNEYPKTRDELYEYMKSKGVFARRYFYPLISDLPMYSRLESANGANLVNAKRMADSVLCIPMHSCLSDEDVNRVLECIL